MLWSLIIVYISLIDCCIVNQALRVVCCISVINSDCMRVAVAIFSLLHVHGTFAIVLYGRKRSLIARSRLRTFLTIREVSRDWRKCI